MQVNSIAETPSALAELHSWYIIENINSIVKRNLINVKLKKRNNFPRNQTSCYPINNYSIVFWYKAHTSRKASLSCFVYIVW